MIKKNIKVILASLLIGSPILSHAQSVDWDGIRVGYNKISLDDTKAFDLEGASIGYSSLTRICKAVPFCVETGLYADWNWKSEGSVKTNLVDVSVPINLGIKIDIARPIALFPYAGLNLKAFVFGETKAGSLKKDLFNADDMGGAQLNRFQAGWHVGVDAQVSCFTIGVNYGKDFSKFISNSDKKLNSFQLRAGVNF